MMGMTCKRHQHGMMLCILLGVILLLDLQLCCSCFHEQLYCAGIIC